MRRYADEDEYHEDTPCLEHPHYELLKSESYESESERRWYAWVKECERLLGHSLDGDQTTDGYSMDYAYAAWEAGLMAEQHVAEIRTETRGQMEERR